MLLIRRIGTNVPQIRRHYWDLAWTFRFLGTVFTVWVITNFFGWLTTSVATRRACVASTATDDKETNQQTTKLMDDESADVLFTSGTEVRMHSTSGGRAIIDGCILFMMRSCIVASEILPTMVLHPRLSFRSCDFVAHGCMARSLDLAWLVHACCAKHMIFLPRGLCSNSSDR